MLSSIFPKVFSEVLTVCGINSEEVNSPVFIILKGIFINNDVLSDKPYSAKNCKVLSEISLSVL